MHAKTFVALLLPILAVSALPAKRDVDIDSLFSQIEAAATNTAALAALESQLSASPALETALESAAIASVEAALGTATQVTVLIATVSGTPLLELSSIGGPAVTIDPTGVPTSFAGFTVPVVPPTKNGAPGLAVSRPLLTGVAGALAAVAGGAFMIL